MARVLILSLTFLLLWTLVAQANHYLAPLQIYLFVGGLFVTYAALRFPLGAGFAAVMAAGCLFDAASPVQHPSLGSVWSSTHLVLFCAAFAVIYSLRDRLAHSETLIRVAVALLANLALFLALSFTRIGAAPVPGAAWLRLFSDLLASQVVIVLIAPWFFALQRRALVLARLESAEYN